MEVNFMYKITRLTTLLITAGFTSKAIAHEVILSANSATHNTLHTAELLVSLTIAAISTTVFFGWYRKL